MIKKVISKEVGKEINPGAHLQSPMHLAVSCTWSLYFKQTVRSAGDRGGDLLSLGRLGILGIRTLKPSPVSHPLPSSAVQSWLRPSTYRVLQQVLT